MAAIVYVLFLVVGVVGTLVDQGPWTRGELTPLQGIAMMAGMASALVVALVAKKAVDRALLAMGSERKSWLLTTFPYVITAPVGPLVLEWLTLKQLTAYGNTYQQRPSDSVAVKAGWALKIPLYFVLLGLASFVLSVVVYSVLGPLRPGPGSPWLGAVVWPGGSMVLLGGLNVAVKAMEGIDAARSAMGMRRMNYGCMLWVAGLVVYFSTWARFSKWYGQRGR